MDIMLALPFLLFWSAVLSFIPITFYLMVKNPPIYKAQEAISKGIFILGQDAQMRKDKRVRVRTVAMAYSICLLFFTFVYAVNRLNNQEGVDPFDILSTLSILFFWFSVLSYFPIAVYLFIKNPWRYKEEGVCLTRIYVAYGLGILIFSIFFAVNWLKNGEFLLQAEEIFVSLCTMFFSSVVIAYLPILIYVYVKKASPYRIKKVHPNIIFIIYSVCFLVFSSIYVVNWISDKRAGIVYKSLRDYFLFY